MRRIILGVVLCSSWMVSAQQDVQFTQFTQNKLLYNPGYTANRGSICLDLLHRSQWVGFDNAPTTQNFNADIPISFLHGGIGLIVTNDQIGFFQDISFGLSYAYQMDFAGGKLGFGLMVDFKNKSVTSGDWVFPDGNIGGFDPFVAANGSTSLSPDLNVGVYYENDKYWGGLSTTRGIEGTFTLGSQIGAGEFAFRSKRHFYLMGGYNWNIANTNWTLMPALMVKSDLAGPMTADINVNAMYNNRVWGGVTYRNQDALAMQAGLFIMPSLKLGYSYDITLSDISVTSGGSHEIMLGYCFRIEIPAREKGSNRNPRFL